MYLPWNLSLHQLILWFLTDASTCMKVRGLLRVLLLVFMGIPTSRQESLLPFLGVKRSIQPAHIGWEETLICFYWEIQAQQNHNSSNTLKRLLNELSTLQVTLIWFPLVHYTLVIPVVDLTRITLVPHGTVLCWLFQSPLCDPIMWDLI